MQERTNAYLLQLNKRNVLSGRVRYIIIVLSLLVIISVFWGLKLTGITLAGEAFCGKNEHSHGDDCVFAEDILMCDIDDPENHTHTEACYGISDTCSLEEHIHVAGCYCDINADLETSDDWEMSLAGITRSSSTAENVALVAQSQLGYTESTLNFEVDASGATRGITRYGQWYGNPYGDWSAMFVSFCLHYAGVEEVPANAGPESMRLEWAAAGLYEAADEYAPQLGNVIFLRKEIVAETEEQEAEPPEILSAYEQNSSSANAVAIITGVSETTITVIEGDLNGAVAETTYAIDDPGILGYGIVPEVSSYAVLVAPPEDTVSFANTVNFSTGLLSTSNRFVFYAESGGNTYAFDGNGNAVQIYIDDGGRMFTDLDDPSILLWTFSQYNYNSYAIQNVGNGRYLHPFFNGDYDNGITTPGRWGTSVTAAGGGLRFSHSAYITLDTANSRFRMTRNQNENITFRAGMTQPCTVWLDGTNGGIMSLGGSPNQSYSMSTGSTLTLPTEWTSPDKYDYKLRGWYDITNNRYYAPGDKVHVTGNMVFYADWIASTYDVGQYNSYVTDTVSTNGFITTRLFDYGVLFNLLSENVNVTVDANGHSETWNLLTSGNNSYDGSSTLNFILRDWDVDSQDISFPNGHNDRNNPTDAGTVYMGLYTERLRSLLFDPNVEIPGKYYVGEADHLFQLCLDPSHEHYGYYYYNSERNAASYNQSDQRFYVYDYLECTRDSANSGNEGKYADFLPFNSPYANSNGKLINTYNYAGLEGEYNGTTHYMYDSRYNDSDNSPSYVGTNFWYGMSMDVNFYLPNAPGAIVPDGGYGNQDIYGKDMHFRFSGDDDVWIFIDGKMVLDLGGLHGMEAGDINFATGVVTVNGVVNEALSNNLKSIGAGDHTLTLYYLERGSSMSNCAIYFNLAPRFEFGIQKEDVLTREVLNGAQFSVYMDEECTVPAELWSSKKSHDNGESATNVFTVVNGEANMWGMGAGNTYYIRETRPPDNPEYSFTEGIIRLSLDRVGTASYDVKIVDGGEGISPGFTIHGLRLDEETQKAYIIATNAPEWVKETTTIQVAKQWNDSQNHSGESVTVYLTVTDSNGTVRRLQEAVLSSDNNWIARWDNMPKYEKDGVTPIKYGVEETYTPGYYSTVEQRTGQLTVTTTEWRETTAFENGKVYILKNSSGQALSTMDSSADTGFKWVSVDEAKDSPLAQWTAYLNWNNVRLTNKAGQTITFYYGNGTPTDFFAYNQIGEDNDRKQYFNHWNTGFGIVFQFNNYYLSNTLNSSNKFQNTTDYNQALRITPVTAVTATSSIPIEGLGYMVTNTPLDEETSLTVQKNWVIPPDMDSSVYEREQVTVKLFANGEDTGRTATLTLKNGWTVSFKGLPYKDGQGKVVSYSVKEIWVSENWIPHYGEIFTSDESVPNYSTTLTNTYRTGGPELPSTGSASRLIYILGGLSIMLGSLTYGIGSRRKRERRVK